MALIHLVKRRARMLDLTDAPGTATVIAAMPRLHELQTLRKLNLLEANVHRLARAQKDG